MLNLFLFLCFRQDSHQGQIQSGVQRPSAPRVGKRVPLQSLHHHQKESRAGPKSRSLRKAGQNLVPEQTRQGKETKQETRWDQHFKSWHASDATSGTQLRSANHQAGPYGWLRSRNVAPDSGPQRGHHPIPPFPRVPPNSIPRHKQYQSRHATVRSNFSDQDGPTRVSVTSIISSFYPYVLQFIWRHAQSPHIRCVRHTRKTGTGPESWLRRRL